MRVVTLLIIGLFALQTAHAVGIGVNQASLSFQDVLPGGYARKELVITTDSATPVGGEVLLRSGDESMEWLTFSSENFTFSRESPYKLYVEIQPPPDARIDSYRVNMSILTGELSFAQNGQLGTATRASLGVPVLLSMTGDERRACTVASTRVLDAERDQSIEVQVSILNTGNVRLNPSVSLDVYDKFRSQQVASATQSFGSVILPTLTGETSLLYEFTLPRDQYWATITVPDCGYSTVVTFDVLDVGEVKDDGEFIKIDAPSWSKTGDIIPINAVFRNRGVRSLRANFRGTITSQHTGQIVKVINTDTYIVDSDVTADLETFFNPLEPGRYTVTGKVFYNDKLTIERNAILNVRGDTLSFSNPLFRYALYGLLFIAFFFIFLIVLKKRQQRRR